MRNILLVLGLLAVSFNPALAQVSPVQVSYLPSARTGAPNIPITIFATVVNSGSEAMQCAPQTSNLSFYGDNVPDGIVGLIGMYAVDNGVITSGANQLVAIPAGGRQDYIAEISVNMPYAGVVRSRIRCFGDTEFGVSVRYPLVNDILLTISNDPQPDIIMIGDTTSRDGVARVGQTGPRAALMAVAAVNIGAPGTNLEVIGSISGFPAMNRALSTTICEIDAAGTCQSPEAESVTIANWATNEVRLFAVRTRFPEGVGVPFYPGQIRLFAAVRPPAAPEADRPLDGDGILYNDRPEVARTSTAMDVEIGEAFYHIWDPGEPLPATYGCEFRGDFDDGGLRTGLQGGRLAIWPDGEGGAEGHGWTRMLPGQQVFSIDIPDWDNPVGTITLHGSGQGGASSSDGSMPIHFTHDLANSGVRFTWEGDDTFSNDFISEGQMRCAGQPAQTTQPFEPNVSNYRLRRRYTPDDFEGGWDGDEASANDYSPAYALEIIGVPAGDGGGTSFNLGDDGVRVVERANTQPDGDIDVGQAFVQFFELLGGAATDPGAASIGTVFVDGFPDQAGDSPPDCMVVLQTDSGDGPADQDARLHTFVRDGADRNAAFTVCWD